MCPNETAGSQEHPGSSHAITARRVLSPAPRTQHGEDETDVWYDAKQVQESEEVGISEDEKESKKKEEEEEVSR